MILTKIKELKRLMAQKGFTGAKLAKETNISQSYIVQIIAGRRKVLATTAKKICNTLQCDFDDIFALDSDG